MSTEAGGRPLPTVKRPHALYFKLEGWFHQHKKGVSTFPHYWSSLLIVKIQFKRKKNLEKKWSLPPSSAAQGPKSPGGALVAGLCSWRLGAGRLHAVS